MSDTHTTWFQHLCRTVLCVFALATFHPASLWVPWTLHFAHWTFNFGPTPAYGQPTDPDLAPTPDADSTDPFIIEKAQELGNDPVQIFNFVRDEIGYESYKGSLRGARGTLWSKAGNALDQASLLIALLRASGIPARYAQGTLPDNLAQQLILSMFPAPLRVVGFVKDGAEISDPANDPKLLAETREHYWVEFGAGFQAADPTFANAQIGDTFTAKQGTFTEVPDNLRHKVTIRLKRELVNLADQLFGNLTPGVKTVLEETFIAPEVVGKPLSIGHFVTQASIGAPIFTSTTNTYSPFIAVGDEARNSSQDEVIRGVDYQEILTNFPLGSQILTGVFLEIDVSGPDGPTETFARTLVDRIGFAVRQNGGSPNLNINPNTLPILTDFDVFTLQVTPSLFNPSFFGQLTTELTEVSQRLQSLQGNGDSVTPDTIPILRGSFITLTRAYGIGFQILSDLRTDLVSKASLVKAYFVRPRLTLVSSRLTIEDGAQSPKLEFAIDLRKDDIRAAPFPGQSVEAQRAFHATRGLVENVVERDVLSLFLDEVGTGFRDVSTASIFEGALTQGLGLVVIGEGNQAVLDALEISAEAKARISEAIAQDRNVIVPGQSIDLNNVPRIAWYEIDPVTGRTIGVAEDGGHLSTLEWVGIGLVVTLLLAVIFTPIEVEELTDECEEFGPAGNCIKFKTRKVKKSLFDVITGTVSAAQNTAGKLNDASIIPTPQSQSAPLRVQETLVQNVEDNSLLDEGRLLSALDDVRLLSSLGSVVQVPLFSTSNPPFGDSLFTPETPGVFNGLTGTGVAADIIPDPDLFVPFNGAQVETAFRVGIKNLGATTDTFDLNFANIPAGFEAKVSLPSVEIPPNEIAEIGVYLIPANGLPAPGTPVSFTLEVTSQSSPAITTSDTENFTVPDIHGVILSSDPPAVSTTPGTSAEVKLTLEAVGNVAESVTFDLDLSPDLSANGGLSPVSLGIGETTTQTLTLIPSANTPLNSTLTATIMANFGAPEPVILLIPVQVVVPGAESIGNASVAAAQLGNTTLANRLNELSIALTNLVQDPNSAVFKSQALAALDSVLSQLANDPNFSSFVSDLTAARNALAAANTAGAIQTAVNSLGTALDAFATVASTLAQHNVEISLLPNRQVAQPQTPASFEIRLHNIGTETTTYDLSLSNNLPAGVTVQFSQTAVTLARDEFSVGVTVTLTQTSTTEVVPFSFAVNASVNGNLIKSATGSFTVRNDFISVVGVIPEPPFVNPGNPVNISARLLNAVNQTQQVEVFYTVTDPNGQIAFTSTPVPVTLTLQTSLVTVDLNSLDTTGFALGQHTIEVTVTDANDNPIPGATGQATLFIGSPVTADLSVDPQVLPPGTSVITNTLQIDSTVPLGDPLTVVGQVPLDNFGNTVLNDLALNVNDNFAYAFAESGLHVVNIADPTAPVYVRNASAGAQVSGEVDGSRVIAIDDGPSGSLVQVNARGTLIFYALSGVFGTPDRPGRVQTVFPPYQLAHDVIVSGNIAFVATNLFCFDPANNDIFSQHGEVLSFDISNPTAGLPQLDALFSTNGTTQGPGKTTGCWENGGNFNILDIEQANATTLLVGSTTATGTNTQTGVGLIRVVDISDPTNLSEVNTLQIPGTVQVHGIVIAGTVAFVIASEGGWRDPFVDINDPGPTGNVALATVDVTDPRNPQLIHSEVLTRAARGLGEPISLGNGRFAFSSLGATTDTPQIIIVDASDPNDLNIVTQFDVPAEVSGMRTDGDFLYTSGPDGLTIYQLGGGGDIPVTAQVQIPTNTGVEVVSNSFNIPPTQIITDTNTLVWEFTGSQTVTWQSTVSNLQPGEAREVTLGATIDFTFQGAPGQLTLPPTFVTSQQILAIDPPTQTVRPGEAAPYTLTVKNPTDSAVTYDLSVQGVPQSWVDLAAAVTVPANGEVTVALTLTSDLFAALAEYGFVVTAMADGTTGAVVASLVLDGEPTLPAVDTIANGVVVDVTPSQATAGRGTDAFFSVRVTNTGSEPDTFALSVALPAGFSGSLAQNAVEVPPGASNFREVALTLTPPANASPGSESFTVTATSTTAAGVSDQDTGTVNVVGNGVEVSLSPSSGTPTTTYQMTVKNTGQSQDTFDLALGGPAGLVSTPSTNTITLNPGASQTVPITLADLDFAFPGSLDLIGIATSRGNPAVQDSATVLVTIASTQGLTAAFEPATIEVSEPGPVTFLLLVQNIGNTEDAYAAEIMDTTGPVTASLTGLDGQPTQQIALFRLPGLSTGALVLQTTLTAPGQGQVSVTVTSLTNGTLTDTSLATVQTPGLPQNHPPEVEAGPNQQASVGQTLSLAPATFTDEDMADTHTATVEWGDGTQNGGTVLETNGSGTVTASHSYTQAGDYTVTVCVTDNQEGQGCDTFAVSVTAAPGCPVCTAPAVIVDSFIALDAANLAGTTGVLAPFASFAGQTITIDLGNRPLQVTSSGRISVLAGAQLQPAAFHQAGNHSTPNLVLRSSCTLLVEAATRGVVKGKLRSLSGVIETTAEGGKAGDLTLVFDGGITINGGVQSLQEKLPDNEQALSGTLSLQSQCGDIQTGPASWLLSWGENPGSGAIHLEATAGDLDLAGLILNRTNHTVGSNAPPLITVVARHGGVRVDGSQLVLDEFLLQGTRYDLTSGLLTLSRVAADVGQITIQAQGDIVVSRDVRALALNRPSFAAVATAVNSNSPQGGEIHLRSLQGTITVRDRALQASGKGDNGPAGIELIAEQDVVVATPVVVDAQHQPTMTTAAEGNKGRGGVNLLQSCDGNILVEAGAQVVATGKGTPGTNEVTADNGAVTIQGTVDPAPVSGSACEDPAPLS
jgi:uncharacterized membrane protein